VESAVGDEKEVCILRIIPLLSNSIVTTYCTEFLPTTTKTIRNSKTYTFPKAFNAFMSTN